MIAAAAGTYGIRGGTIRIEPARREPGDGGKVNRNHDEATTERQLTERQLTERQLTERQPYV